MRRNTRQVPGASSSALETVNDIPSPLEQFEILPLIPMKIGNFLFSFTNPSFFLLLTVSLVLLLLYFVTKKGGGKSVPNAWQSLVEFLYDFVLNLVNEQIGGLSGNVKQKFFPCILVTFTFLLFCNLQGMIPYSFTVTSHFLITLGLSFSIFIGITIVGFQRHGLHFLSFFLPAGVPLPLAPFLVLLELIPHSFRALSLGIRLFANMMAGHSLVKILSGSRFSLFLFLTPPRVVPNVWHFLYFMGANSLIMILQPKIYDHIMLTVRISFIPSVCSQVPVIVLCLPEPRGLLFVETSTNNRRFLMVFPLLTAALSTPPDIWCQILASFLISLIIELAIFVASLVREGITKLL